MKNLFYITCLLIMPLGAAFGQSNNNSTNTQQGNNTNTTTLQPSFHAISVQNELNANTKNEQQQSNDTIAPVSNAERAKKWAQTHGNTRMPASYIKNRNADNKADSIAKH